MAMAAKVELLEAVRIKGIFTFDELAKEFARLSTENAQLKVKLADSESQRETFENRLTLQLKMQINMQRERLIKARRQRAEAQLECESAKEVAERAKHYLVARGLVLDAARKFLGSQRWAGEHYTQVSVSKIQVDNLEQAIAKYDKFTDSMRAKGKELARSIIG
jgi:hypothetical protein